MTHAISSEHTPKTLLYILHFHSQKHDLSLLTNQLPSSQPSTFATMMMTMPDHHHRNKPRGRNAQQHQDCLAQRLLDHCRVFMRSMPKTSANQLGDQKSNASGFETQNTKSDRNAQRSQKTASDGNGIKASPALSFEGKDMAVEFYELATQS